MSSLRHVRTAAGKQVVIGKELGKGGEGTVYQLEGDQKIAVKLYHQGQAAERRDKVTAMVSARWHSTTPYVAFPIDLLINPTGNFVGFTMRRVGHQRPIHNLYSPTSRRTTFPKADFRFLLRTALNISRAVAGVHQTGCVIGDVNQSGFLVGDNAMTTLIDCDSFQVRSAGKLFLCKVAVPEFTPPELSGKRLDQTARTSNHDSFGLAVLIFHLLFMGRHPFAGRFLGKGDMPVERAIKEFRFAYSSRTKETQMEPPPNVPVLTDVPKSLADAFELSFGQVGVGSGRPKAANWVDLLESVEKELVPCKKGNGHHYFRTAQSCPWCRMEQAYPGFLAFVPPVFSTKTTAINLGQLIAAIQQVPDPGRAPELVSTMPAFNGSPTGAVTSSVWTNKYFASLAASVAGVIAFQFKSPGPELGVLMFAGGLITGLKGTHDSSPAGKILLQAKGAWQGLETKWKQVADNTRFLEGRRDADGLARQVQALPDEEASRLAGLTAKQRDLQLKRFLERFYIDSAKIKGIGNTRKVTLRSYGIETAADVERYRIERISGFGPAMVGALIGWRTSIERKFVFDPSQPVNPADITAIKSDIARKKADLEARLRQSVSQLQTVSDNTRNTRAALQANAVGAWNGLKQAELDAQSFGKRVVTQRIVGFVAAISLTVLGVNIVGKTPETISHSSTTSTQIGSAPYVPPPPSPSVSPPARENTSTTQPVSPPPQSPKEIDHTSTGSIKAPESTPVPAPLDPPIEIKSAPAPVDASPTASQESASSDNPTASAPPGTNRAPLDIAPPSGSGSSEGGPYVPPPLPTRSITKRADVQWIQMRLSHLGFLRVQPSGIWDDASRDALQDFKFLNRLPHDYVWNILTEQKLSSTNVISADGTFVGVWSESPGCIMKTSDETPIIINTQAARSGGGECDFTNISGDTSPWRIRARCTVGDKSWIANIRMTVKGRQLVWSSEKGTTVYSRCR